MNIFEHASFFLEQFFAFISFTRRFANNRNCSKTFKGHFRLIFRTFSIVHFDITATEDNKMTMANCREAD